LNLHVDNGDIGIGYRDENESYKVMEVPFSYEDSQWHHVYMAYTGKKYLLYIDGIKAGEVVDTNAGGGTQPAYIGSYENSHYFTGSIDEVSLWKGVMNSNQIVELYNQGQGSELRLHSKWKNLISWWRMGDSQGDSDTELKDVMEKHDGTPQGISVGSYIQDTP
jgi:hypothetical protein